MASIEFEVCWFAEIDKGVFLFLPANCGRVAGRSESDPEVEISPSGARAIYIKTLSSLGDNLKMARKGRNM